MKTNFLFPFIIVVSVILLLGCPNPAGGGGGGGGDYNSANIGTLKYVPAGRFQRDATATNISVITQPYRMSQHEITRAQWRAIFGDANDPSDATRSTGLNDPVQRVNWYHAVAFTNKLSLAEGLTPVYSVSEGGTPIDWAALPYAGIPTTDDADWNAATATWTNNGYRLPTEMEWMWAAMGAPADGKGGGTNTTGYLKGYAGSTEGAGQTNLGNYAWYSGNSVDTTHPAGTKLPNELGLYDMSGNVFEWSWDRHGTYPAGTIPDYRGAESGTLRVGLGCSRVDSASGCAVRLQAIFSPIGQINNIGFRVVRS